VEYRQSINYAYAGPKWLGLQELAEREGFSLAIFRILL
jgi:hypothetical protein